MIVDVFENSGKYYCINPKFEKAFKYIFSNDFAQLPCGRYEIDGDDIYANVDEYQTKTQSRLEYHRKYIDIQFLAIGEENIGYCNLKELEIKEDFNEKKDVGFGSGKTDFIKIYGSKFMILFPQDAHQPCMAIDNPLKVKKVVVKVKVD